MNGFILFETNPRCLKDFLGFRWLWFRNSIIFSIFPTFSNFFQWFQTVFAPFPKCAETIPELFALRGGFENFCRTFFALRGARGGTALRTFSGVKAPEADRPRGGDFHPLGKFWFSKLYYRRSVLIRFFRDVDVRRCRRLPSAYIGEMSTFTDVDVNPSARVVQINKNELIMSAG